MLLYASGLGLVREQREYVYPRIYAYVLGGGVKLGYTSHAKPAFFVSQITPVPEYVFTSSNS